MYSIALQEIAESLGYPYVGPRALSCQRCVIDSRELEPGDLFFALAGERTDGHRFLDQALRQGAKGLVVSQKEAFYAREDVGTVFAAKGADVFLRELASWMRQHFKGPVIAVTGSQGKTSTKDMLAQILEDRYQVVATEGNYNNELGLPLMLTRLTEDTELLVLEMGMDRPGDIDALANLAKPTAAIVTGIGLAHAEHFGSKEGIAEAKAELFPHLPLGSKLYLRGKDREFLQAFAEGSSAEKIWCCIQGECEEGFNQCRAEDVELLVDGSQFTCHYRSRTPFRARIPFSGTHFVDNSLLAIACARDLGMSSVRLQELLPELQSQSDNRMTYHLLSNGSLIINDAYNANPDSVQATIDVLAGYKPRQIFACLGDMKELGPYEESAHRMIGRYAAEKDLDGLLCYGPLSRYMAEAAKEAGMDPQRIYACVDQEACAEAIVHLAGAESVVLVKGSRAMAMEGIVAILRERDIRGGEA